MITLHPVVSQHYRAASSGADVLSSLAFALKGHKGFHSLRPHLQYYVHAPKELLSYVSVSLGLPIVVLSSKGSKKSHKIHRYFPELMTCHKQIMYSFIPSASPSLGRNLIVLYYDKGMFCALSHAIHKLSKSPCSERVLRRFPFRSPFMRSKKLSNKEELPCALQILTS